MKFKSEIVGEITEELADLELAAVEVNKNLDALNDSNDRIGAEIDDLKGKASDLEAEVTSAIAAEADENGKYPPELSNTDKRNAEKARRLREETPYLETLDAIVAAGEAWKDVRRQTDSALRKLKHVGACMANRRAILNALGGLTDGETT